jgi:hypothetical protein
MSHQLPGEASPSERIVAAGYVLRGMAENVAYGCRDEEDCMRLWMASSGHRDNILGNYEHFGTAIAYDGSKPYYTQVFGRNGQGGDYPVCPTGDADASPVPAPSPSNDEQPTSVEDNGNDNGDNEHNTDTPTDEQASTGRYGRNDWRYISVPNVTYRRQSAGVYRSWRPN